MGEFADLGAKVGDYVLTRYGVTTSDDTQYIIGRIYCIRACSLDVVFLDEDCDHFTMIFDSRDYREKGLILNPQFVFVNGKFTVVEDD